MMKKAILGSLLLGLAALTSCLDNQHIYQESEEHAQEFNEFDFSTTQDVKLQVSYQNMGGIKAGVYFEVYDQMPVEDLGYKLEKKEGIQPLYTYNIRRRNFQPSHLIACLR